MNKSQWLKWWEAQSQEQTCRDCGLTAGKAIVVPQLGGFALCYQCGNRANQIIRDARKAQLAAMPRCEAPDCKRRATLLIGHDRVGLCKRHYDQANHKHAENAGGFLFYGSADYGRASLMKLLQTGMFPAGEDSPLFTGTPQTAPASPYQPEAQTGQPAMFDRREYIAPRRSARPATNPPPLVGGLFD